MSYGNFERIEQVSDKFGIKVKRASFIAVKPFEVDEFFLSRMERALLKEVNFINEEAIRQHIITPILDVVSDNYEELESLTRLMKNSIWMENLTI